jgi:predicted nucleotidyltransferase
VAASTSRCDETLFDELQLWVCPAATMSAIEVARNARLPRLSFMASSEGARGSRSCPEIMGTQTGSILITCRNRRSLRKSFVVQRRRWTGPNRIARLKLVPCLSDNPAEMEMLRAKLSEPANVAAAYLFGSVARGSDNASSDLDVGLLYSQAPAQTLEAQPFQLESELCQQLRRPVQLVVMNEAPVDLVHRILRDGILLFDKDPSRRIAFEVRSRNAYFDLLPFLREYRQPRVAS